MSETHLHPSAEQAKAIQAMDIDGPLVMINLLRFDPDGGREEYARYGAAAAPFLMKSGAKIRFHGAVQGTVIGPDDDEWDEVILVEYPNKKSFFEMTGHPDYPARIRADALIDSRLYCSQESSL